MKTPIGSSPRSTCGRRPAFTLVELLTVIAIIAILTSLAAWGAFAVIGTQHRRNTEATIRVLNKMLQARWDAVVAGAKKEPISPANFPMVFALAGGDTERAQVIWTKVRLCEAFPVAYKELDPSDASTIINTFIPSQAVKPHLTKYRSIITSYPTTPGVAESSACLLLALRTLPGSGVPIDDQLKSNVADTDNDGLPELVDSWAKPLAFFRFAWNNQALQDSNPAPPNTRDAKFADPVDRGGSLLNNNWYSTANRTSYEAIFHPVKTSVGNAYYVTPVIVSRGPDGKLDEDLAAATAAGTGSFDNIYSFKLR